MEELVNLDRLMNRALSHRNPSLIEKARKLIPFESLDSETSRELRRAQQAILRGRKEDETILREEIYLTKAVQWFKNEFFSWVDQPRCVHCGELCKLFATIPGRRPAVDAEELYACPQCTRQVIFCRYNDASILLDTREGRCDEHAQGFALILKALGYRSRVVVDIISDHVWNEYFSMLKRKWIHIDPSEAEHNNPLMYELGWKKQLHYAIAFGEFGVQNVTSRYVSRMGRQLMIRNLYFEEYLESGSLKYMSRLLPELSPPAQRFVVTELIRELWELILECPVPRKYYQGRKSGSAEWRRDRGETHLLVQHFIEISPLDNCTDFRYSLWYSSSQDMYSVISEGIREPDRVKKGFRSLTNWVLNITRKIESDWKMAYLAREDESHRGEIRWVFRTLGGLYVTGAYIMTSFFTVHGGQAVCRIHCGNKSVTVEGGVGYTRLTPSNEVHVEIHLSGGEGTNAWQHAQLARQPLQPKDAVSFGIKLYLTKTNCFAPDF